MQRFFMRNNRQQPFYFYPMFPQPQAWSPYAYRAFQLPQGYWRYTRTQPLSSGWQVLQYSRTQSRLPGIQWQYPQYRQLYQAFPANPGTAPAASGTASSGLSQTDVPKENPKASVVLKPEDFTAKGLTQEDLDEIVSKYGDEIDDIFNLAPGQSWMFGKAQTVTNAFFIQELIKVTMKLKPATFRQRMDAMSRKRSNLRTAFAYRGQETPYQVVLKNRRPELRFVDRSDKTLSELEEELGDFRAADRRRGFDLERDPLLRITVFSTAQEDTYALIMSQPHINHDGASDMMLYRELLVDYAVEGKMTLPELAAGSYQDYAKYLQSIDKEAELRYWEELLRGSAVTRLPGRIQTTLDPVINNMVLRFDAEQGKQVAALPGRYKATLNSIVQSAWGIMLQKIYGTRDAVFGSITSGRAAEVADSSTMTGGFVNAFPVRVISNAGESFEDVVSRTQKQIVRSLQMAHCSPDEIGERLNRVEPVFDHLLNFHNYGGTSKGIPAFPGLSFLGVECFDNLSTGFSLYFRQDKEGLNCIFSYDRRSVPERKVQILMDCYRQVLEQLLQDENGEITVDQIRCPDISAFITAQRDEEEERDRLMSFLRTVPLFAGVDDDGIAALAERTEVLSFADSDEILRENQHSDGLHIVMEGYVHLTRTTMHGWENPLLIRKRGEILSAESVLENNQSYATARVMDGQARLVYIPREAICQFMEEHPAVALNLVGELGKLVKSFSSLWINAE